MQAEVVEAAALNTRRCSLMRQTRKKVQVRRAALAGAVVVAAVAEARKVFPQTRGVRTLFARSVALYTRETLVSFPSVVVFVCFSSDFCLCQAPDAAVAKGH